MGAALKLHSKAPLNTVFMCNNKVDIVGKIGFCAKNCDFTT